LPRLTKEQLESSSQIDTDLRKLAGRIGSRRL
jgi:hypothetical protein